MLFPLVVDDIEQHTFLEFPNHLFAIALGSLFEIDGDVIYLFAVSDRNKDIFVHSPLLLIYLLDNWVCHLRQFFHTAFEGIECRLCHLLTQRSRFRTMECFLIERHLHSKSLHHLEPQALVVVCITRLCHDSLRRVVYHIRDIHPNTLTHQGMATLRIDNVTLLVHYIVVLYQSLTDTEVILLHFLLRTLDRVGNHRMLNHLALFEAHLVHHGCNTLRAEHTHQVILKRHIEHTASRVSLTTGTASQLSIDTTAFVPLRTDNRQTTCGFHLRRQFDISTTTCHIRCNRHHARASSLSDHIGFLLMQLGIQDIVLNLTQVEHTAQQLTYLDACRTYQHGSPLIDHSHHLFDNGIVFFPLGTIDTVVHVHTRNRLVGRDNHHIEFVDVPELTCLRLGGTGHARQLVVHTEVVL